MTLHTEQGETHVQEGALFAAVIAVSPRSGFLPSPVTAMIKISAAGLGLFLAASSAFAQISIFPANPKPYETVRVRVPVGAPTNEILDRTATRVSIVGGKITVSLVIGQSGAPPEPFPAIDFPLGAFPGGNSFDVEVIEQTATGALVRSLGTSSFSVALRAGDDPTWNLTDIWWNPTESGWGFNMVQHGSGIIFATWFLYGPDNKPVWYVMPEGHWTNAGQIYGGPIYRTSGPPFCPIGDTCPAGDFDPSKVTRTLVGAGTISINPANFDSALLSLTIEGKTVNRLVRRQSF